MFRVVSFVEDVSKPLDFVQNYQVRPQMPERHALHHASEKRDQLVAASSFLSVIDFKSRHHFPPRRCQFMLKRNRRLALELPAECDDCRVAKPVLLSRPTPEKLPPWLRPHRNVIDALEQVQQEATLPCQPRPLLE